jgi:hypothetical protein
MVYLHRNDSEYCCKSQVTHLSIWSLLDFYWPLNCKVANATRSIWYRGNEIISDALNIKTELQHRIKITGDKTLGEYNLQISDITEGELVRR